MLMLRKRKQDTLGVVRGKGGQGDWTFRSYTGKGISVGAAIPSGNPTILLGGINCPPSVGLVGGGAAQRRVLLLVVAVASRRPPAHP